MESEHKEDIMVNAIPTPPNGAELILNETGIRYAAGMKLSGTDIGNAMIATARVDASQFGPGPADMPVNSERVPEHVKGTLVSYAS